jgi:hypothetical protein
MADANPMALEVHGSAVPETYAPPVMMGQPLAGTTALTKGPVQLGGFCSNCGGQHAAGVSFCNRCGSPIQ